MRIKVKILKNEVSKQGFRKFKLSTGSSGDFEFGGEMATKSNKRSWWILFDDDAKWASKKANKATKFAEGKEIELDTDLFKVSISTYEIEKDGKLVPASSAWLIPVAMADATCIDWKV
jgi:hypothetical protein